MEELPLRQVNERTRSEGRQRKTKLSMWTEATNPNSRVDVDNLLTRYAGLPELAAEQIWKYCCAGATFWDRSINQSINQSVKSINFYHFTFSHVRNTFNIIGPRIQLCSQSVQCKCSHKFLQNFLRPCCEGVEGNLPFQ